MWNERMKRTSMNRFLGIISCLLLFASTSWAQILVAPVADATVSVGPEEAKVIIDSNSDEMSLTNNYGIEDVVKSEKPGGIYRYTLTVPFTEDDEDDFKKMQVTVRLPMGEETFPITLYKGKAYVGTFTQKMFLDAKKNENQVLPEEKKARVTFITKLEGFSVSCDGVALFVDGVAQTVKNKSIVLSTQPDGELTRYQITFSLDDASLNRKPVFRLNAKDAEEIAQTLDEELTYKQSVFFTVIGATTIIEKVTTYEELLAVAKKYSAEYATHHESEYFLAASDAYEAVRTHIDCPINLKDAYQREQNKFIFLRKYSRYVEQAEERWKSAEAELGFEANRVWQYLNLGRQKCQELLERYPEMSWFQTKEKEFDALYKKHPQSNIELPIVSGKVTKGEGWYHVVDGTAIYATDFNCTGTDEVKKKNLKPVGAVQNGAYKVVLREPCSYLFFAGEGKSHPIEYKTQTLDIVLMPK